MTTSLMSTASVLILLLAAGQAAAQDQTTPAPDASDPQGDVATVGEVVVTGSRIARAGFEAPTPVTVTSSEQLTAATPTTIADALRQLPALNSSVGPRGAQTSGGQGGAFLNLRNLGGIRTLTLLDGRRFISQGGAGVVDTNLFPQALVSRVETVTGGASAAYGSDAVAGVVNFILDTGFTGLKGEIQGGISDLQDGQEQKYSVAYGTPFLDGRAHFIGSAEYFRAQEIPERLSRQVARDSCQIISLPAGSPTKRGYACDVRVSNANFNGLITGGPFRGTTFDVDGNPIPFNYGTQVTGSTMVGGDGVIPQFAPLSAGIDKKIAFGRVSYDINDDTNVFAELTAGQIDIGYQVGSFSNVLGNTALQIQADNAFLPGSLRDQMLATGTTSVALGKYLNELPKSQVHTRDNTYRLVAGVNGVLRGWDWNAYAELADSRRKLTIDNDLILPNYYRATDAVFNGSGQIVCRSEVGATPGCIPVNPFGTPSLTPDQRRYIVGTNENLLTSYEYAAAFNVSNEPFSTWAGPVSVAAGLEYRKIGFDQTVDAGSVADNFVTNGTGVYRVGNARPQSGEYDIKEVYFETVVPLAEAMPFAEHLELNAAGRVTEYSTSGRVETWKLGFTYEPVNGVRFRGTRSRDIRAPTLNELFQAGVTNFIPSAFDTIRGVTVTNARSITLGNLDLEAEIADTTTIGAVYSPSFIPGLDLSVDYYDIQIDGAITTPGAQRIIDDCAAGVQSLCDRLFRGSDGTLLTVEIVPLNLQTFQTSGFDIEASYRFSLDDLAPAIGGDVTLRAIGNYTSEFISKLEGGPTQDQAGESGTAPEWRAVFQANYARGPLGLFAQARFTGSGVYDKFTLPEDLPQIDIESQTLYDLRVTYELPIGDNNWTAFVNVNNLFDTLPPDLVPTSGQYDPIGRFFRFGLRFKY